MVDFFDGGVVESGQIVSQRFAMSLADIEKTGGGYFLMAACRELLDKLPRHVLIAYDGESWKIHVPM